jgi:hypothetical protein
MARSRCNLLLFPHLRTMTQSEEAPCRKGASVSQVSVSTLSWPSPRAPGTMGPLEAPASVRTVTSDGKAPMSDTSVIESGGRTMLLCPRCAKRTGLELREGEAVAYCRRCDIRIEIAIRVLGRLRATS